jgi:hypothetical protein
MIRIGGKPVGEGGARTTPFGSKNANLAAILTAIGGDLILQRGLVGGPPALAVTAVADANAQTNSYVQGDVETIAALADDVKAQINAVNTGFITAADTSGVSAGYVEAEVEAISTLITEIQGAFNAVNPGAVTREVPQAADIGGAYDQTIANQLALAANELKQYLNNTVNAGFQISL